MNQPPTAEMVPTRYAGARCRFFVGDYEKVTAQAELQVGVSTNVIFTVRRCAKVGGEPDAMPSATTIVPAGARSKATGILDVSGIAELEIQVTGAEGSEAWHNLSVRGQLAPNTGNASIGNGNATIDG